MKRSLLLLLSLGTFALFNSGCSTPAYFGVPNQRFESPVVAGETFKGSVGIGYETPTFVVTVKDTSVTPPSDSGSEITKDPKGLETSTLDQINLDLRLGLFKRFEISTIGDLYHLKYQFLGSTRIDSKADEWVGAVTADWFSVDRESETTTGGNTNKYELEARGYGGSIIVGYRDSRNVIYYVNVNYLDFEADTTVTQNTTRFDYSGNGDQFGTSLGLRYEQSPRGFYANIEWSYTKTGWENLGDKEWGTVGGLMGVSW